MAREKNAWPAKEAKMKGVIFMGSKRPVKALMGEGFYPEAPRRCFMFPLGVWVGASIFQSRWGKFDRNEFGALKKANLESGAGLSSKVQT
jgi:hypothetical protein